MSFKLLIRKGECCQNHTIEIGKNFLSKPLENIKHLIDAGWQYPYNARTVSYTHLTERIMLCTAEVVPPTIKKAWAAPKA